MIGNFGFNLLPNLDEVDWEAWERYFPDGMGASVFSSPGWQRLMQNLLGSEFELKMLVGESGARRYTLPVYVRRWRYRRLELVTHPTAYYMRTRAAVRRSCRRRARLSHCNSNGGFLRGSPATDRSWGRTWRLT
jgi:hypothetical protein